MLKIALDILFSGWIILVLVSPFSGFSQDVTEVEARLMAKADGNIDKYRKGDVSIQFKTSDKFLNNAQVEIIQKNHDFLFGCILFPLTRDEQTYRPALFKERFKNLFNFGIFPFYWPGYERTQGMPVWENMAETLEWCKANEITTKGHPLVWACRSGVPKWLGNFTIAETEALSKSRVINITAGFKGKIDIWDVVNEPVNVKTWKNKLADIDNENDWGVIDPIPDISHYVSDALTWAYTGNPEATLIINEFNTIARKEIRERFYQLLIALKEENAPISGIGIQAHEPRQEWYAPEEVWNTFDLYAEFGHPIHITELHPQSSGKEITGRWRSGTWDLTTQADFTEQFVRLCFGHPAVVSVNWWGLSDRNIWQPGGGLLDENYQPKPVYDRMYKLIHEVWKTNLTLTSDGQGKVSFRGFYGTYNIRVTSQDGKKQTFPIHVRKDEANQWIFTVQ